MSLANFTTNLSLKLRNKAGSPVFSKKGNKQELSSPFSEGEASDTADDPNTTSPKPRRRVSDPQMPRTKSDTTDFNRKFRSEGEDEDEVPVIKPKPKYPKYVRALGPMPSGKSKHSKSDDKKNTTDNEPDTTVTFQLPVNATIEIGGKEDASKKDFNFDAYKAAMLSEKTRMRLQKVTMEHQAATEKLQADKERIEREHERTLQDIRRDEDEDSLPSPLPPRDSDESMSTASESTNSSRKQSIDSITIPLAQRGFQVRQISSGSGSSEDKPGYALSAAEREQREREQKQLDLFLGQFELDSESAKQSQKSPTSDISDLSPSSLRDWKQMNMKGPVSPSVYSLGAKSLDEKLRILLDPSFQAREGKFIRSPTSPTSETSTEVSQDHGVDVGSGAISRFPEDRRTHFAPIRSIEKPYKTKVIGLNTARIYNADMIARMDTFNQKKQELEKKVSSILQESSKTKDIYYSDSNKTDEQKVASLRRQQQSQKPPNIHIPNTTQRVIVSATDLSPRQQAEFTYSTAENTDVSHDRLDRNVQHVVELLQDSHVEGATTNTSADITSLLSTLKRPRIDPNTECRAIDSSSSRVLRRTEDDERNIEFRNRPPNTQSDSQSGSSRREYDHTQAQGWRPGPPSLSGINSDFKYNNLYSR